VIYTTPIETGIFIQDLGTTLTIGGSIVSGAAIVAQQATINGDLVIDLNGANVYDGMQIILVNASQINGQWQNIVVVGTSECIGYDGILTLRFVSHLCSDRNLPSNTCHRCAAPSELLLCFVALCVPFCLENKSIA
jgi:hypothetical protein